MEKNPLPGVTDLTDLALGLLRNQQTRTEAVIMAKKAALAIANWKRVQGGTVEVLCKLPELEN